MQPIIEVSDVTMRFNMSRDKVDSLKEYFIRTVKRQLHFDEFFALQNVSFKVWPGDVLGIVGLNGSGKSTLLKLIAGIMRPSKGTIMRTGSISPLIELGAGFSADLTARENVFLNGAVLGYSKQYMAERYDEIISFAELEQFQDVAIKNYSSGMKARLGFSIATITKPEILIVDEILSVGDFLFKEKSEARIKELMGGGTTVLLVSHSLRQIETLCNRVLWLKSGRLIMDGDALEVCRAYEEGSRG
ncbi:MAG: ABC transporter ATP-binding protein [Coriobacteriales bacterium]|jgi:ABC-type polysaccharide/polyol phosphate transport system ATPase subunit|nr:ABC transporter ATP-binding protein [Coriobacteriales bacterium]